MSLFIIPRIGKGQLQKGLAPCWPREAGHKWHSAQQQWKWECYNETVMVMVIMAIVMMVMVLMDGEEEKEEEEKKDDDLKDDDDDDVDDGQRISHEGDAQAHNAPFFSDTTRMRELITIINAQKLGAKRWLAKWWFHLFFLVSKLQESVQKESVQKVDKPKLYNAPKIYIYISKNDENHGIMLWRRGLVLSTQALTHAISTGRWGQHRQRIIPANEACKHCSGNPWPWRFVFIYI